MDSPVAPQSTRDLTVFTSPVSVVSTLTSSFWEVGLSSDVAIISLGGRRLSHRGRNLLVSAGWKGIWGLEFCTALDVSELLFVLISYTGKIEKQLFCNEGMRFTRCRYENPSVQPPFLFPPVRLGVPAGQRPVWLAHPPNKFGVPPHPWLEHHT